MGAGNLYNAWMSQESGLEDVISIKEAADHYLDSGELSRAISYYQDALAIDPAYWQAHANLSLALADSGEYGGAVLHAKRAMEINPIAELHDNLGDILRRSGDAAEAIKSHQTALSINPNLASAYNNIGNAYVDQEMWGEAIASFNRAIHIDSSCPEPHWNLALVLLLTGDLKNGWREYEWRWRRSDFSSQIRDFSQPLWDGEPLGERRLLLHAEQGNGDSIQFIRYLRKIDKGSGKIVLECPNSLVRLFSTFSEVDMIIGAGERIPTFDLHAPLMSLPYLLGTELDTIPAEVPYIEVEGGRSIANEFDETKLNVGVVWAGSAGHKKNSSRSIDLSCFMELAGVENVQLYSLQVGDRVDDLQNTPEDVNIIDMAEKIDDYLDTAQIIQSLDLVISVDTSVAHLAGAVGKPVWVLLQSDNDWRWLLDREDSPWYPTARLFRQKRDDEWGAVFEDIKRSLLHYHMP